MRPVSRHRAYLGIEQRRRHTHVRRMCRNAMLTHSEHRMSAVEAVECIASGMRHPSIARGVYVPEILTTRTLQDVSRDGRHVANLCRSAGEDRLRNYGEVLAYGR